MKSLNPFFALTVLIFIVSCNNNPTPEKSVVLEEKIETIEVGIEGMTCEIGCAKLIESKVYKLESVTASKVNFEEKIGQFSFDSNKISREEIVKNINGIAGGDLYKVTSTKTVE
ncbi:MAG: heavy-metal-associated domain-containing protein [Urechidicola sp.]|nr:heavy-metal-associated domain-containing protein [Urechidicola sp.]